MGVPARYGRSYRRQMLAFGVLGNGLPIAVATATGFGSHHPVFFVGAVWASITPFLVTLVPRRQRVAFYLAAYGGLPALVMLQAFSGGAASGYSVLMLMAMIWFGLQASDRELLIGVGVLAACAYLPMLIFGAPAYPVHWGHATLLVLVGGSVAGSLRIVTRETQRLNERLRREAIHDGLTGLLNRRGWMEATRRELARAQRRDADVGLVVLDLDNLKLINDTGGHHEGDRVLCETAERLNGSLRAGDLVARLGGDEFAALLSDSSVEQTIAAIARLRAATPELGAFCAGVVAWDGAESIDELQRRADAALYEAKAALASREDLEALAR